jgi:Domain of unknown function (DUF4129)
MDWARTIPRFLLLLLLVVSAAGLRQEQDEPRALVVSEYIAELNRFSSAAKRLDQPEQVPDLLKEVPRLWRIQTETRVFEVPSEWLRLDLQDWQRKPSQDIKDRICARLQMLSTEAASFQLQQSDVSQKRVLLNGILAGAEFKDLHGPTWIDHLKQRLTELLIRLLGRVVRASAVPTIGNIAVYVLITLALLVLAYWIYRAIHDSAELETILRYPLPVSSKEWKTWMEEARLAADAGNWREAIHLSYWCGISFLEAQGLWRPDVARTPREYLRLLPSASEHRATLGALTRSFELVWYGTQPADAQAFSETLAQLEKLGCQSN